MIYIASPVNVATGGTELLQQLCYCLRAQGTDCLMYYFSEYNGSNVEKKFKHYNNPYTYSVIDQKDNIIVISEINTVLLYKFKKIQKYLWWLSVDNYFANQSIKNAVVNMLNKHIVRKHKNMVQSEYARIFIKYYFGVQDHNIFYLSDYLGEAFLEPKNIHLQRDDVVLYNPKKGFEFTKKLIENDHKYKWVPLSGLTEQQMEKTLLKGKVYVDFGNFPGKDRIPREAVMMGCCLITGVKGAAGNELDIPIPREYKFKEDDLNAILNKIDDCMINFQSNQSNFTTYRNEIMKEKEKFVKDVKKVFGY